MPTAVNPSAEARKRAAARAREWKLFRQNFLYSQANLAHALRCGRRTVCAVESGREVFSPRPELLRRFQALKLRHEKAASAAPAYASTSHLHERRA